MNLARTLSAQDRLIQKVLTEKPSIGLNLSVAAVLFVSAFGIYCVCAVLVGRTHSPDAAYFQYLADAFLHGRLYVLNTPSVNDLTLFEGQWYVGFPPLAAILLMPWVAISGIHGVNTVVFGAAVGAATVAVAFLMLQSLSQRDWTKLSLIDNVWLSVFFGFGTVHWYMSTMGSVWFLGQICAALFMMLAALLAITNRSPLLSVGALAVAMLSRPHIVFCYPLLAGIAAQHFRNSAQRLDWRRWIRWVAVSAIPITLVVGLMLSYNYARFGRLNDFGYYTMNVDESVARDLRIHGQFSFHYFKHNFFTMVLQGPNWEAARNRIVPDLNGMSVFITMPVIVLLLRVRRRDPFVIGAWVALTLMVLLLLTYYNTGWIQFGYRFGLDFMVPLLLLLAVSAFNRVGYQMRILILIGVLVNAWGVEWYRFFA